ncbi:hypothetical protein HK098_004981 [Nowakowskiella sp. JEL0407]|nr:hypothetical protein HK098_004981 [Nowakowskiella sp. JEL0407]
MMGKACGLMSISWLRLAFHDFGTYNIADKSGGLDGSILTAEEALYSENLPLAADESNIVLFQQLSVKHPSITPPDWIALGALTAIRKCGGPDLLPKFRPGRVASFTPNNYYLLPHRNSTLTEIQAIYARMGFTDFNDVLTLTIGSHTLGRLNSRLGDADFSKKPPLQLDSTPNVFDNEVFKSAVKFDGNLTVSDERTATNGPQLENDRYLMSHPSAMQIATLYATNQEAFFAAYGDVFMRMLEMGHDNLGCPLGGSATVAGCNTTQIVDTPTPNMLTETPVSWKGISEQLTKMFYVQAPLLPASGSNNKNVLPNSSGKQRYCGWTMIIFVIILLSVLLRQKEAAPLLSDLKRSLLLLLKIYDYVFPAPDEVKLNSTLASKIIAYSWIEERHLDIPKLDSSLNFVIEELAKVNNYKAPKDKLVILQNTLQLVVDIIEKQTSQLASSDHLLPVLILAILKSNPPNLISNVKYILRFRNQEELDRGENQYCVTNVMSAISFLYNLSADSLTFADDEEKALRVKDLGTGKSGTSTPVASSATVSTPSIVPMITPTSTITPTTDYVTAKSVSPAQQQISTPSPQLAGVSEIANKFYSSTSDFFGNLIKEAKNIGDSAVGNIDAVVESVFKGKEDAAGSGGDSASGKIVGTSSSGTSNGNNSGSLPVPYTVDKHLKSPDYDGNSKDGEGTSKSWTPSTTPQFLNSTFFNNNKGASPTTSITTSRTSAVSPLMSPVKKSLVEIGQDEEFELQLALALSISEAEEELKNQEEILVKVIEESSRLDKQEKQLAEVANGESVEEPLIVLEGNDRKLDEDEFGEYQQAKS